MLYVNMRITNQNLYAYKNNNLPQTNPSFTSLLHVDQRTGNVNDSWFNRDIKTLERAADEIHSSFPNGADILIYGCSTGEENISLKMLRPEDSYRVIGYDNSVDALRIGKRGVYTLFSNWYDSYLLPVSDFFALENDSSKLLKQICQRTNELRKRFHKFMYEVPASREFRDINNKSSFMGIKYNTKNFVEKFYRVREEFREQIDLRYGNFLNVGQVRKERPVGGIFFRNAIYHLCKNNVNEVLNFDAPPQSFANKEMLMENIVKGLYKTLDDSGIFVIGNHIKEHLFLADETVPDSKKVKLEDTPFYNPSNIHQREHKTLKCYKESPLINALLKDCKFEPIGFSKVTCYGCDVKVPVIFKKIRI